jgi:23S rRNA pseudouridine1911/1915/1917 synthase
MPDFPITLTATPDDAGKRLDQYLAAQLSEVSRARVQQLIAKGDVLIDNAPAKASLRLKGGERITVQGPPQAPPLRAMAEEIPLDIVYEDDDLAIVNKPAGMMVHAGAGATEDARNRGTLVNALLHHFGTLSEVGGELRPGIVHRLDRATSGLMVVAKNDLAHHKLAEQFSRREVHKTYLALIHGWPKKDHGTIRNSISRDVQRRIRMTTKRSGGREAVTHYAVQRKLDTAYGKFALLEVKIETGRTHQIRVHLADARTPILGDALYGKPSKHPVFREAAEALGRPALHARLLGFVHPTTGKKVHFEVDPPADFEVILTALRAIP